MLEQSTVQLQSVTTFTEALLFTFSGVLVFIQYCILLCNLDDLKAHLNKRELYLSLFPFGLIISWFLYMIREINKMEDKQ